MMRGQIFHPSCQNLGSSCPVGASGHRPRLSLEGPVRTESRLQLPPPPTPCEPQVRCSGASGAAAEWAGQLGFGLSCPGVLARLLALSRETGGCPGGGDAGSLLPSHSPCSIHFRLPRDPNCLPSDANFKPRLQNLTP